MKNVRTKLLLHPYELNREWVDCFADHGVDVLGLHPEGGGDAHLKLHESLECMATDKYRDAIDYAKSLGLTVEYEVHCLSYLLPRELFAEHPDWFRMNAEGERVEKRNLCVSSTEALDYVADRAAEFVKLLYGSSSNYYLWLDDVKGSFCHCPRCRELSPSDQNLTVMNAILRRLRRDDLNARLAYLAYYECMELPKSVKPDEGIFLEYAPFEREIGRSAQLVPDSEKENAKKLLDYFGKEGAWVLEYWYDNSWYVRRGTPFSVDNAVVADDLRYYRELGFENISSFACMMSHLSYRDFSGFNKI